MEQFVRAYTFEPYGFYKVVNNKELPQLRDVLKEVLTNKPTKFEFDIEGTNKSADVIRQLHNGRFKRI
mgnify:CR=1 FL=1